MKQFYLTFRELLSRHLSFAFGQSKFLPLLVLIFLIGSVEAFGQDMVKQIDVDGITFSLADKQSGTIELPMLDGSMLSFVAKKNSVLSPALQALSPNLSTFDLSNEAEGITGKLTLNRPFLMVRLETSEGIVSIQPQEGSTSLYVISDGSTDEEPITVCEVEDELEENSNQAERLPQFNNGTGNAARGGTPFSNGGQLRTYKMAIAVTGEYYEGNDGGYAAGTATADQFVTNRVVSNIQSLNQIFTKDLGVLFELTHIELYSDSNTDPFIGDKVGGSGRTTQANMVLNSLFDQTTYDIGHVLHNHGTGLAQWTGGGVVGGSICNFGKNNAWSGSWNNYDEGWIKLFAHEVGHQFGASHTWNGNIGGCSNGQQSINGYEIGSGTTIMSYRGLCGIQNVPSSGSVDHYFHTRSIEQMLNRMSSFPDCGTVTANTNSVPIVDANPDGIGTFQIPIGTPFILTGQATDLNNPNLLYSWEQMDQDFTSRGLIGADASTNTGGPLFRSFPASSNPTRVFQNNGDFEVLPQVARTMNFALTVRDCFSDGIGGGGIACDGIAVEVVSSGPLEVTSSNCELVAGETNTIEWDANGSENLCSLVDVMMSTDGGSTYDQTIATGVSYANEEVDFDVPSSMIGENEIRFKVTCADNSSATFFAVSAENCSIVGEQCPLEAISSNDKICLPAGDDSSYTVTLPFDFNYYGKPFNEIEISINGYVNLGNDGDRIAIYDEDLETNEGGTICYEIDNGSILIYWDEVAGYNSPEELNTFQLILTDGSNPLVENGNIKFIYDEVQSFCGNTYLESNGNNVEDFGTTCSSDNTLNGSCLSFNAICPLSIGIPQYNQLSNITCGETVDFQFKFVGIDPANDLSVAFDDGGLCNITPTVSALTGDTIQIDLSILGAYCNQGYQNDALKFTLTEGDKSNDILLSLIVDQSYPQAICRNIVLNLTPGETYTLTAAEIDDGSYATCGGLLTYQLNQTEFTCADAGANGIRLTVTDEGGNSRSCYPTVTVVPAYEIALDIQTNNLTCFESLDGDVTITPSDGVEPYTYSYRAFDDYFTWESDDLTDNSRTALSAGRYNVTVTDANGCFVVEEFELTEPDEQKITPYYSVIHPTCDGLSDGSITYISTSNGDGNYTITLEGNVYDANNSWTALSAGLYTLVVTDDDLCSVNYEAEIMVINPPVITASVTNVVTPSCIGENDGSFTVQVSGGQGGLLLIGDDGVMTDLCPSLETSSSFNELGNYQQYTVDGLQIVNDSLVLWKNGEIYVNGNRIFDSSDYLDSEIAYLDGFIYARIKANEIARIDILSGLSETIINTTEQVYDVITFQNKIYWVENEAIIMVANPDGSNIELLYNGNSADIVDLAAGNNQLFWLDQYRDDISSFDLTTLSRTTLVNNSQTNGADDISYFKGKLFWSNDNSIFMANEDGTDQTQLDLDIDGLDDIYVDQTGLYFSDAYDGIYKSEITFSHQVNGVENGEYFFTFQDGNGCQNVINYTLDDPTEVSLEAVITQQPTCEEGTTGAASFVLDGGTGPYTLSVDGEVLSDACHIQISNREDIVDSYLAQGTVRDFEFCNDALYYNFYNSFLIKNDFTGDWDFPYRYQVEDFECYEDAIYYINSSSYTGLYKYNSELDDSEYISTIYATVDDFIIVDDIFYFIGGGDAYYAKVDLGQSSETRLFDLEGITSIKYHEGKLYYYVADAGIWQADLDGSNAIEIVSPDGFVDDFDFYDDKLLWLYDESELQYTTLIDPTIISSIPLEHTDRIEVIGDKIWMLHGNGTEKTIASYDLNYVITKGGFTAGEHIITITDANGCSKDFTFEMTTPEPPTVNAIVTQVDDCNEAGSGEVLLSIAGGSDGVFYCEEGEEPQELFENSLLGNPEEIGIDDSCTEIIPLLNGDYIYSSQGERWCDIYYYSSGNSRVIAESTHAFTYHDEYVYFSDPVAKVVKRVGVHSGQVQHLFDVTTFVDALEVVNDKLYILGLGRQLNQSNLDGSSFELVPNFPSNLDMAYMTIVDGFFYGVEEPEKLWKIDLNTGETTLLYEAILDGLEYEGLEYELEEIFHVSVFKGKAYVSGRIDGNSGSIDFVREVDINGETDSKYIFIGEEYGRAYNVNQDGIYVRINDSVHLVPFTFTHTITGLTAGDHTFTVKDGLGCTQEITVNVPQATPPTLEVSVDNYPSCNGEDDGSLTLNVTGGTDGLFYCADGEDPESICENLEVGEREIFQAGGNHRRITTISDDSFLAKDGLNIFYHQFGQSPLLLASNASIMKWYEGYVYFNSFPDDTFERVSLDGKVHEIIRSHLEIEDDFIIYNDKVYYEYELEYPTKQLRSMNLDGSDDQLIFEENTNTISILKLAASDGKLFWINNETSIYAFDLETNQYEEIITGTAEYTFFGTYEITAFKNKVYFLSESNEEGGDEIIYCANADGSDLTLLFGTDVNTKAMAIDVNQAGLYWTDRDDNIYHAPFTFTKTITGLTQGNHSFTVKDGLGCSTTIDYDFSDPNAPDAIVITPSVTDVLCNGAATGAISLTVTGGVGTKTFEWSNEATTQNLTGLTAGSYSVTVTDENGCLKTSSFSITEPTAITFETTSTDANCQMADGSATVSNIQGGNAPYTIAWSDLSTNLVNDALASGTYNFTITDASMCTTTGMVTVDDQDGPSITSTKQDASCNGGNDGSVTVNVSGGQAPYTYTGTDAADSPMLTGLTAGSHMISAQDANGCVVNTTVVIGEPTAISVGKSANDISCFGEDDGTMSVQASGGTGNLGIEWSDGSNTSFDRDGLSPGLYGFTVTDQNGCSVTGNELISQPLETIITPFSTHVLCNGAATGSISLILTNNGPWTYEWSTGATTKDVAGLEAGTYQVTVTDLNGCSNTASAEIIQPDEITFETSTTDANCLQANGSATVSNVQGAAPVAPYSVTWSNGDVGPATLGLTSGTYSFTITDANMCTATGSVTVDDQDGPSITTSKQDVSCNAGSDGAVTVNVSGGQAPYTYTGTDAADSNMLSNAAAGTYTISVVDASGCSASEMVTIVEPGAISFTSRIEAITCPGENDGRIDIETSGGTGDIDIMWADGRTKFNQKNLVAGTYAFTLTDENDCTLASSVEITDPAGLVIDFTKADPTCNGGEDGFIKVNVSGGTGTPVFEWSNDATTQDLLSIGSGTYTVTVSDESNCEVSEMITLTDPAAIQYDVAHTDVNCNQSDGTITLTNIVMPEETPYRIDWADITTFESAKTGLAAGDYSFTITNDICSISETITIEDKDGITALLTATNISCNGEVDGMISTDVSGGTAPYTYLWGNASTENSLTGLAANTYSVTVTDAKGCTAIESKTIVEPALLSATAMSLQSSCGTDGSAEVTIMGGTAPYSVDWPNDEIGTVASSLLPGTHTIYITDASGCQTSTTVFIEKSTNCDLDGDGVDDASEGDGDRDGDGISNKEDFDPTGYFYCEATGKIIDGATVNISGPGGVNLMSDGSDGFYQFTVDAPGHYVMTVDLPSDYVLSTTCLPSGSVDPTGQSNPYVLGNGERRSSGYLSASDCTPYYFEFDFEAGDPLIFNNNIPVKGCGCANERLKLTASATPASCESDGTVTAEATGGVSPYTYEWDNGMSGAMLSGLESGMYHVTVTDGCGDTKEAATYVGEDKIDIAMDGESVSGTEQVCELTGVPSHALWLNHFMGRDAKYFHFGTDLGSLVQRADGTATVTGQVYDTTNPGSGFTMEIHLKDAKDWAAWSAMGGQYKDDARYAGMDYLAWTYYHLDDVKSKLIGFGDLAGIDLSMTHRPKDSRYGFQIGQGADDKTAQFGMSGWFYYHGAYEGHGDINVGASCGEPVAPECAKSITLDCADGTTDINIDVTGANAYTFNWSNGATTQNLTGVEAGKYTVTVTSGTNCLATTTVCVTAPTAISISATIVDVTTNGGNDGSLDLTVSGGEAPYAFMWYSQETTEDLSGLTAGSYMVTVTDANGCTVSGNYTVSEPNPAPIEDEDENDETAFQLEANDGNYDLIEDESLSRTITALVENTSDLSSTFTLLTSTANGQIDLNATGEFEYMPSANFNGTDMFTYQVCVDGRCEQGLVTLDIAPVNDAPIATSDFTKVKSNVQASFPVLRNDIDVDGDQLVITTLDFDPIEVTASVENGEVVFQSAEGLEGLIQIAYSISDQQGGESTGILEVRVDAPVYEIPMVEAYPNPFDGKILNLKFSGNYRQNAEFYLVDDLGKQMNLGNFNLNRLPGDIMTIDLTQKSLKDANYVLRIIGERDVFVPIRLISVE